MIARMVQPTQMIDEIGVRWLAAPVRHQTMTTSRTFDLTEPGGSAADEVMMADEPVTVLEEVVLETGVHEEYQRKLDFTAAFPPANEVFGKTFLSHLQRRHRPSSRRPLQTMRRRPLQAIRRSWRCSPEPEPVPSREARRRSRRQR